MKRTILPFFQVFLVFLFSSSVYSLGSNLACIRPIDNYATEVILNRPDITYNLNPLRNADNVIIKDNQHIFLSHYSSQLSVILSEKSEKSDFALSVKLQAPVKLLNKRIPYLIISSTLNKKIDTDTIINNVHGWIRECEEKTKKCSFKKENISVTFKDANNEKTSVSVEIEDLEIPSCSEGCFGKCFSYEGKSFCLKKIYKDELSEIFALFKESFNEFLKTAFIEKGEREMLDTEPYNSKELQGIVWKNAMKKELLWLKEQGIIRIPNQDIIFISSLAEQGTTGNSRIIYGNDAEDNEYWQYYYQSQEPELKEPVCEEFPVSLLLKENVIFHQARISFYYIIPLIITLSLLTLLTFLIILARIIHAKKRR